MVKSMVATRSSYVLTLALSLLLLLALGSGITRQSKRTATLRHPPLLAIEHDAPLTVSFTLSRKGTARLIDIDHDTDNTIFVSTPAHWQRGEVRGAKLKDVTSEPPAAGFVRWTLPPHAGVTFKTAGEWSQVRVANPSGIPLTLRLTGVDLATQRATHDAVLVKDETVTVP